MYVVAITELRGTIDDEAAALARELGCTAYDARMLLAPGVPAVVKRTPDRDAALELLRAVRERGHGAVACDVSAVVASEAMTSMRRFRLGEAAISVDDRSDALPYGDILALLPAVRRNRTDTETVTRERKLSVGRALMTSGLSLSKTVKKETHAAAEEREGVLYVFRRNGATPWLLRERGTVWTGHGVALAPSETENFRLTVAALRERAPGAAFDDRLVSRRAPERASVSGGAGTTTVTTSSDAGLDLLAHLLALSLARSGAYR